jgi:hypothetical protein
MSEPVTPAVEAAKPEAVVPAPQPAPEAPKDKPAAKINAAPREAQKAVPATMIEADTEFGTKIWIQKAAVIAVKQGFIHRFSPTVGVAEEQAKSTIVTMVGEWQVLQSAEDLVKSLS